MDDEMGSALGMWLNAHSGYRRIHCPDFSLRHVTVASCSSMAAAVALARTNLDAMAARCDDPIEWWGIDRISDNPVVLSIEIV